MITDYYRPVTLPEALELLKQPGTLPLGGGMLLSQLKSAPIKAIDLQSLGLNKINKKGNNLEIGATVTLQQLLDNELTPEALKTVIKRETPLNIRNAATVAGTVIAADGRSTFATALLALDAKLNILPMDEEIEIGNFLPLREEKLQGKLVTTITIPLNVKLTFESVARTPADKPIVCAALAIWPSGRSRLALGGYGKSPFLAMDGTEHDGINTSTGAVQAAARNTFHEATDDWASADYRMDVAATLAKRCLE